MASKQRAISVLGDEDLLVEILIRLPNPRSATRCKSVCKGWNSLISAPYFSRRFVSHHRRIRSAVVDKPPLLIPSYVRGPIWSFLRLPNQQSRFGAVIVDCFRDLLLLKLGYDEELGRSYMVCNLFTQQWVVLPLAPWWFGGGLVRLVCEASNSKCDKGEAFTDHCVRQFCVVIMHDTRASRSELVVFYSKSREWKCMALDIRLPRFDSYQSSAVSLNGKLYWVDHYRGVLVRWDPFYLRDHQDDCRGVVARFDPVHQRDDDDHPVPLPPASLNTESVSTVSVSQGALHMVVWETGDDVLSVLRLEEEKGSWERLYRVFLGKLISISGGEFDHHGIGSIAGVLGLHSEKSEMVLFRCDSLRKFVVCNMRSEEMEVVTEQTPVYSIFQPKVALWPTPIPDYEKLLGAYNGTYGHWFQPSKR